MEKPKVIDKGASFIKVLDPDFSKQLQLPHDFTNTFNGYVPHRIFIESPITKKCWRVEVEKDVDGTICLQDGWATFAEAHCLEVGNFLLFECEEQSIFQVKIYDRDGCQINKVVNTKENRPIPPNIIDIESYECEPKTFRKSRQERARTLSMLKDINGINKKQRVISKNRTRFCNVGENKTSFSVLMAKMHQFIQLSIPMAVGLEKKLASKKQVVLQDAEGKCWPVRLGHKKTGHALLVSGWKHFLEGNNIVIGDTLNFDFVSDTLAQVHLTRSSEPKCHSKDTGSFHMDCERGMPQSNNNAAKDQTIEASITTKKVENELKSSSFSFRWSKNKALTSHLYIPKAIAVEQKLKNKESLAIRDTNGKYWPVEVKKSHDGRVTLTKGWVDFWKGLSVRNGDTLEFEFVSNRRIQVSIRRRDRPHETSAEEATVDMEVMDIKEPVNDQLASTIGMEVMMDAKGPAGDILDSSVGMEVMDIKGFANDLLASAQEHYLLQTPPGFKPLEQHLL